MNKDLTAAFARTKKDFPLLSQKACHDFVWDLTHSEIPLVESNWEGNADESWISLLEKGIRNGMIHTKLPIAFLSPSLLGTLQRVELLARLHVVSVEEDFHTRCWSIDLPFCIDSIPEVYWMAFEGPDLNASHFSLNNLWFATL